jgi:hypothetical protein
MPGFPVAQAKTPKRPLNNKEMIKIFRYLLFIYGSSFADFDSVLIAQSWLVKDSLESYYRMS